MKSIQGNIFPIKCGIMGFRSFKDLNYKFYQLGQIIFKFKKNPF